MFNLAVISLKDLIKYLVGFILVVLLLILLTRYFYNNREKIKMANNIEIDGDLNFIADNTFRNILDKMIPAMKDINNKDDNKENNMEKTYSKDKILEKLLKVELAELDINKKEILDEEDITQKEIQIIDNNQQLQEKPTNNSTEVVTQNPIAVTPTDIYQNVQIRNQTSYILTEEILKPDIEVNKENIIIFHTHTCESYTPTNQNQYEASGTYRTIDLTHSVARVGDELTSYLKNFGYNVNHDKTYHDYPAYTGSYARSLKTVEKIKQNCNADVIIDLHRDAIGSNSSYAPTVRIGEEYAAQLMFVIGTDAGGLWHPNWQQNLKFAVKVQEKSEEMYPGLFKPIIVRNSRYNQHVSKAATIIEVGATGNTLEQCLTSMRYLSNVLNETIK